jgi:hypothetical protein
MDRREFVKKIGLATSVAAVVPLIGGTRLSGKEVINLASKTSVTKTVAPTLANKMIDLETLNKTTLKSMNEKLVDNVFKADPLLGFLKASSTHHMDTIPKLVDCRKYFDIHVGSYNPAPHDYTKTAVITANPKREWRYRLPDLYVSHSISREIEAQGPETAFRIIDAGLQNSMYSLHDMMEKAIGGALCYDTNRWKPDDWNKHFASVRGLTSGE